MEMIQADSLARFYRLEGYDVRFQAGNDPKRSFVTCRKCIDYPPHLG
jgi:methionyl-tRNA synthetase